MKILITASLGFNFTGSYIKKSVVNVFCNLSNKYAVGLHKALESSTPK